MSRPKSNRRLCQTQPGLKPDAFISPLALVKAYHQRTKHGMHGYAQGPASLDWDAQPRPYRHYEGCITIALPFSTPAARYAALFGSEQVPAQCNLTTLAQLLEYSLSLAAIKVFGPDSWTVRCNPSSGNLHPTEAYLICGELEGLGRGIYHYQSERHQLEQRARFHSTELDGQSYLALSSIHWREAWKYGERAYRYCQLDVGHAMAAVRYSAALLGWQVTIETALTDHALAALCGINRSSDFDGVEPETPDLLLRISPSQQLCDTRAIHLLADTEWFGLPSLCDPQPFYHWQIIDQITAACRKTQPSEAHQAEIATTCLPAVDLNAAQLIKQRRSALAFQPDQVMGQRSFFAILTALLPNRRKLPFDILPAQPRLHPVLFVHRVEGLTPGLYCLPRSNAAQHTLQQAMHDQFLWQPIDLQLPLYLLQTGDARQISKQISCHQAIAADSAFSLGMLAEFDATLCDDANAWRYRELYWEAGVLGQTLYLEAEAHGYRGTGIGCFLDDQFHQLLGLGDQQFQSLYHFTVGTPVVDQRITTLSPYAPRSTP